MSWLELQEILAAQEHYKARRRAALPEDLVMRRLSGDVLNTAPDIWIAGDMPLYNYRQILADNYDGSGSDISLKARRDNYIYVRARNNAGSSRRGRVAQLYAAELDLLLWPNSWQEIYTDTGSNISPFPAVAAQAVAVASQTFMFSYVRPHTSGYTLIAQINDLSNQLNPKPEAATPLDMAVFNANPRWASTNTCLVPVEGYVVKMDARLTTPSSPKAEGNYLVTLDVKGCTGLEVELQASATDSQGKAIHYRNEVKGDGRFFGSTYYLKPNFDAYVSMYIYTDDMKKVEKAELLFQSSFQPSGPDLQAAVEKGLIDGQISLDAFHSGYLKEARPFMALRSLKLYVGGKSDE